MGVLRLDKQLAAELFLKFRLEMGVMSRTTVSGGRSRSHDKQRSNP
jgi:hypothetical protein